MVMNPEKITITEGIEAAARMHRDAALARDDQGTRLATALLAILNALQRQSPR